jgi:DNA-binding NtrC family response regulator
VLTLRQITHSKYGYHSTYVDISVLDHTSEGIPMRNQQISVLVVGDRYIYTGEVETLLRHTRWRVAKASSVDQATAMLARQPFHVVLCQHTLQSGTWKEVVDSAVKHQPFVAVIVLYRDDGAAMVDLYPGVYDVLPVPCDSLELYATVTAGWRHCMQQKETATAATKPE